MQVVQTLHRQNIRIFVYPKRRKLRQAMFSDKTAKTFFSHNKIHTQGYITLNRYIIGIASIRLPKLTLWATKCVTKKTVKCGKNTNFGKTLYVQSKNVPLKINIF